MTNQIDFTLPINNSIPLEQYKRIDLSEKNLDLQNFDTTSSEEWETYMNSYLRKSHCKVAYGGYLEKRNLYDRSEHFQSFEKEHVRNIHLGIDFWTRAGTMVLACAEGIIHSFQNNDHYGDYGPTIIMEHSMNNNKLYSLYGHLSLESISEKYIGQKILKGEVIAALGTSFVNGDYAPHLHFQIMKDLEGNFGDYPGVCSQKQLDHYKRNCPNPLDFLLKKMPEAT